MALWGTNPPLLLLVDTGGSTDMTAWEVQAWASLAKVEAEALPDWEAVGRVHAVTATQVVEKMHGWRAVGRMRIPVVGSTLAQFLAKVQGWTGTNKRRYVVFRPRNIRMLELATPGLSIRYPTGSWQVQDAQLVLPAKEIVPAAGFPRDDDYYSDSLLRDGGFERGEWPGTTFSTFSRSTGTVYGGSYALAVSGGTETLPSWWIAVDAGQTFTVGGYWRVDTYTSGTLTVRVNWFDSTKTSVGTTNVASLSATTGGWLAFNTNVTATTGSYWMRLEIVNSTGAPFQAFVDNLYILPQHGSVKP